MFKKTLSLLAILGLVVTTNFSVLAQSQSSETKSSQQPNVSFEKIVFVGLSTSFAQSENPYLPVKSLMPQLSQASESLSKPRTIEMFQRIKRQMSMKQVIRLCGEPDKDIGRGIHIYVYELADGSVVRIGTPDDKKIIYVVHVLANGTARSVLFQRINKYKHHRRPSH